MAPSSLYQLVPQFAALSTELTSQQLLQAVWQQLEKDIQAVGLHGSPVNEFELSVMHRELVAFLRELSPSSLPEFLYRVDLPEKSEVLDPSITDFFENLAWQILRREALKVYFRVHYAG
ncbi:MAG: hypothetical protein ACKO4Y_02820 [Flavobacteriales bacterium]